MPTSPPRAEVSPRRTRSPVRERRGGAPGQRDPAAPQQYGGRWPEGGGRPVQQRWQPDPDPELDAASTTSRKSGGLLRAAEQLLRSALSMGDGEAARRALRGLRADDDWEQLQHLWVAGGAARALRDDIEHSLGPLEVPLTKAALRRNGIRWDFPQPPPQPKGSASRSPGVESPGTGAQQGAEGRQGERGQETEAARIAAALRTALVLDGEDDRGRSALGALLRVESQQLWDDTQREYSRRVGSNPGALRGQLRCALSPTDLSVAQAVLRRNGVAWEPADPVSPGRCSTASFPAALEPGRIADLLHQALTTPHPLGEAPVHHPVERLESSFDWAEVLRAFLQRHPETYEGDLRGALEGALSKGQLLALKEQLRTKGIDWDVSPHVLSSPARAEQRRRRQAEGPRPEGAVMIELGGSGESHGVVLEAMPGPPELAAVAPGSPAARAGAESFLGRTLSHVGGRPVASPAEAYRLLYSASAADRPAQVELRFAPIACAPACASDRSTPADTAIPAARSPSGSAVLRLGGGSGPHGLNLSVGTCALRSVAPCSPAERAGLGAWAGQEVTHVDGHPVADSVDLLRVLSAAAAAPQEAPVSLRFSPPPAAPEPPPQQPTPPERRVHFGAAGAGEGGPPDGAAGQQRGAAGTGAADGAGGTDGAGAAEQPPPVCAPPPSTPGWRLRWRGGDPVWERILRDAAELGRQVEQRISPQRSRSRSPPDAPDRGPAPPLPARKAPAAVAAVLGGEVVNCALPRLGQDLPVRRVRELAAAALGAAAAQRGLPPPAVDSVQCYDAPDGLWPTLVSPAQLRGPCPQLFVFQRGQYRRPPMSEIPPPTDYAPG
eukprot:TRINITY_DN8381_c0_g1_i1.p1 TRINITY_DN8381_c0_g1~~TRINITY_DN8381_c0_g1_i1.p1  ORF type:complete len:864 (+),score=268.85 TRINITY_DN8381_c0_g1_i1:82-2592(+)